MSQPIPRAGLSAPSASAAHVPQAVRHAAIASTFARFAENGIHKITEFVLCRRLSASLRLEGRGLGASSAGPVSAPASALSLPADVAVLARDTDLATAEVANEDGSPSFAGMFDNLLTAATSGTIRAAVVLFADWFGSLS